MCWKLHYYLALLLEMKEAHPHFTRTVHCLRALCKHNGPGLMILGKGIETHCGRKPRQCVRQLHNGNRNFSDIFFLIKSTVAVPRHTSIFSAPEA